MDDSAVQQAAQRRKRKEEGKRLKRQKIEESGGHRPRSMAANDTKTTTGTATPEKSRPKRSNNKSFSSKNSTYHRFGRVMEHAPCRNLPRHHTLSIAIPGSIVTNCQTKELRTHLVGQIARAATIYHVDEIIVFDDKLSKSTMYEHRRRPPPPTQQPTKREVNDEQKEGEAEAVETTPETSSFTVKTDPHLFMARLLQYCECPQYLRRQFFPMHPDLQFSGLLSPLDAPHHVRANDACKYREGVVLEKTGPNGMSLVNCGIPGRLVEIDRVLTHGIRCTVKLDPEAYGSGGPNKPAFNKPNSGNKVAKGQVVSPSAPREDNGTYWGYTTRMADSLRAIFDECPYEGGYDVKIGTSERGSSVDDAKFKVPNAFQHALIVFGGVAGIEECVDADESMKLPGSSASTLFDLWLNTCPFQGSRTIRTEEAIIISLSRLNPFLISARVGGTKASSTITAAELDKKRVLPQIEFNDDVSSEESD